MAVRTHKKRMKRSTGFWPRLLTMVAIVIAIVFCIALFFRVGSFTVTGNVRYTADEVIAASGIEPGSNLLLVSKSEASGLIIAKLPYITQVQVHRTLPNSVELEVVECDAAAVVADAYEGLWLIAPDGRLLEQVDQAVAEQYPLLTGVAAHQPQAGRALQLEEENSNVPDAVIAVLRALEGRAVAEHIVTINMEKIYSITMMYEDRYEIALGGTSELDYKITYLEQVVAELADMDPETAGRIDLTLETEKVARFLPW